MVEFTRFTLTGSMRSYETGEYIFIRNAEVTAIIPLKGEGTRYYLRSGAVFDVIEAPLMRFEAEAAEAEDAPLTNAA